MSLLNGPLWAVDTETSGISVFDDRIVSASLVQIDPGRPPRVTDWLVAVDVDIPQGAQDVHGISTEYARAHGRPAREVLDELVAALNVATRTGIPICGFNLAFDCSLIHYEALRWGGNQLAPPTTLLDGLVLDRYVDKWRRGKRTLTAACEQYRVKLEDAHSSGGDALAAARVVWRIARTHSDVDDKTLAELQTIQTETYREHAESLERHIRKLRKQEGKPQEEIDAVDVSREWPIRSRPAEERAA